MSTALAILIVYLVGFVLIVILSAVSLRNEPTAHGQIVGRQIGCLIAIAWPVILVILAGGLILHGLGSLVARIRAFRR